MECGRECGETDAASDAASIARGRRRRIRPEHRSRAGGAALQADPVWHTYLAKKADAGCVIEQRNKLMTPAPFAPIKR
jgi:hypothetical protein